MVPGEPARGVRRAAPTGGFPRGTGRAILIPTTADRLRPDKVPGSVEPASKRMRIPPWVRRRTMVAPGSPGSTGRPGNRPARAPGPAGAARARPPGAPAAGGFGPFPAVASASSPRGGQHSSEKLDLGGHISAEARINDRIRVPEVRLVGPGGEQVGIVRTDEARKIAYEADLDLVEVAPNAKPPVCKIMDFGKFKYEQAQKARESRKNQQQTVVKEQKFRPKIDDHDYETKKNNVIRFLDKGSKVKVTIMFRGREQSRPELGFRLLQRLADDVAEHGTVEARPKQDGRNMTVVLAPVRKGKK